MSNRRVRKAIRIGLPAEVLARELAPLSQEHKERILRVLDTPVRRASRDDAVRYAVPFESLESLVASAVFGIRQVEDLLLGDLDTPEG